jgi:hypothetical protein
MRTRWLAALLGMGSLIWVVRADPTADAAKAALQLDDISSLVGRWKADGDAKIQGKREIWKETLDWSWKFDKAGNAWLALAIDGGKFASAATLKYDPAQKVYVLNVTDKDGRQATYTGTLSKRGLVVQGKDPAGDTRRLTLTTLADGARLTFKTEIQTGGQGPFTELYKIGATKEGETFAGGGSKKKECIVTGGLGTIPVSYAGQTYYVCCTGCKDEFEENPKKYIDELAKKK